jgi:hypothetical protein
VRVTGELACELFNDRDLMASSILSLQTNGD